MRTIHKFLMPKNGGDYVPHFLQEGFTVLRVDTQGNEVVAWVEVDTFREPVRVFFFSYGTGWEIPEDLKYAGTVQCGSFIWHIYYGEEAPLDEVPSR